ncbi:MAG: flippase-like domain-containing protein [Planctomycetes bacterium]|nr:flippase-like domain-containing protein [Planctomycetota bacterium]
MKRRVTQTLWLVIGLVLLAVVVYLNDPADTWQAFLRALDHPWLLVGAMALFMATQTGFYLKWHLISRLAGAEPDAQQSLRLFSTLFLVGTFTPGRAGELAVPLMMRGGARLTGVALINRILESSVTVLMGLVALIMAFSNENENQARDVIALGAFLGLFIAAMVVLSRRRLTERLLGVVRLFLRPLARLRPVGWLLAREQQVEAHLGPFYEANERLLRVPTVLLFCAIMLLIWLMMVAANYMLILATVGDVVAVPHVLAAIAVSAVAMFLAPVPGGVGVSEGAVALFLKRLNYTQNFLPFLLLSRIGLYIVVVIFYFVGIAAGRELPEPAVDHTTDAGVER